MSSAFAGCVADAGDTGDTGDAGDSRYGPPDASFEESIDESRAETATYEYPFEVPEGTALIGIDKGYETSNWIRFEYRPPGEEAGNKHTVNVQERDETVELDGIPTAFLHVDEPDQEWEAAGTWTLVVTASPGTFYEVNLWFFDEDVTET